MEGGVYSIDLKVKVGTPATITGYTDRNPATVVKIEEKKNYNLIYVQLDDYTAIHKDIHAESQKWEYKRNTNNPVKMFKEKLVTITRERKTYSVLFVNKKTGDTRKFQQIDNGDVDYCIEGYKTREDFLKEWSWLDGSFKRVGTIIDNVERIQYTPVVRSRTTNRLVKGCDGVIMGRREKYYDISF
tara:strand:- start:71 stop:628 length:558 start_codon:yes stop_codon:yes gene_type:complete